MYVVYNAFTTAFQPTTATPWVAGRKVVLRAPSFLNPAGRQPARWWSTTAGKSGDPRGLDLRTTSSAEFLGDYVYAAATWTYGAAVWNDTRFAVDCPAIDPWRQSLQNNSLDRSTPAPQQACPPAFGNSDIFAFTTAP